MSRELLEKAAKAAGMRVRWCLNGIEGDERECFIDEDTGQRWEPQNVDGDAFRLAVKLGMNIVIKRLPHAIYVETSNGSATSAMEVLADIRVGGLVGPYAATRLAIVRAAAAIWEAK